MAAEDKFRRQPDEPGEPFRFCFVITPSPDDLPYVTKGIRAGQDGTITFRAIDMVGEVTHPVLAGERLDGRIIKVTACNPANMVIMGYA